MQAQTEGFAQKGMFKSFMEIFREEGVRGLWRVCYVDLIIIKDKLKFSSLWF